MKNTKKVKVLVACVGVVLLMAGSFVFGRYAFQPKTGDLNRDGKVNTQDLSIFLSNFNK